MSVSQLVTWLVSSVFPRHLHDALISMVMMVSQRVLTVTENLVLYHIGTIYNIEQVWFNMNRGSNPQRIPDRGGLRGCHGLVFGTHGQSSELSWATSKLRLKHVHFPCI